jgi:actin-like ATPase involved in cell morphogenesis
MPNSLMNIAQALANKVKTEVGTQTQQQLDEKRTTQLNYELMYKMLESEVEKHILENQGNRCVDEFRQNILTKFQDLVQILIK